MDKVDIFLEDYLLLMGLSKSYKPLLRNLLEYQVDEKVLINASLKRIIGDKINTTVGNIDNYIAKLVKGNVLTRIDRGLYRVDDNLINLSKENNIILTVLYSDNRKDIKVDKE